jgi:hypothetical protein
MAKKAKNIATPTLWQNYKDNPVYQWFHEEIWHFHNFFIGGINLDINSRKELLLRARYIDLLEHTENMCKEWLERELQLPWQQAQEIVDQIKDCETWEKGGQGKFKSPHIVKEVSNG